MKFPKRIRYRGKVFATIYGESKPYPFYRLAFHVAGKRRMQSFSAYALAKAEADKLVRDLAQGSQAAALSARQSRDALAALERLEDFRLATGRRVSLLASVSEYCESAGKLGGRTLGEAVEGYLRTVASVKRKANGLRHAFVSHHFALHANENLTAALAGHAPAMVHAHYKGLATKAEAEKWFAVARRTDNHHPARRRQQTAAGRGHRRRSGMLETIPTGKGVKWH